MEAYSETPIKVHKFLPIVSLGQAEDKNIPWGATIPDQYGNYYYTSFSPLGYAIPWLFVKIFNLPINECSLYIFNSILYLASFTLLAALMLKLFTGKLPKPLVVAISALYLFQPEILHSQGIVYWHQSLFQVVFLLQLTLFSDLRGRGKNITFFVLCVVAPYLEWTGFISDIVFAIGFLFRNGVAFGRSEITLKTERVLKLIGVVACAALSGVLFVLHYLTTVSSTVFWRAVISRYNARTNALTSNIGKGYLDSFGLLIAITAVTFVFTLSYRPLRKSFVESLRGNGYILFVMLFVLIENLIMKQHAVQYTFDRMKGVILLIFLLILCITTVWQTIDVKNHRVVAITATLSIAVVCAVSFGGYITSTHWKWDTPYLENNRAIATELAVKYTRDNSVYTQNVATRGYSNLLFRRGIYEGVTVDRATQLAVEKGKRYSVAFEVSIGEWNMYGYSDYTVIDLEAQATANLTDGNWTHGVASFGNILLFPNIDKFAELLLQNAPQTVAKNEYTADIMAIEDKGAWIWVTIANGADKDKFQYPVELTFE
ncbi:MAG: hypothetical protein LBL96_03560 [Clostridiales bacterium]|jgi:hypothetical protein|nr:hypothetical protein [Clostridiales bacterium]